MKLDNKDFKAKIIAGAFCKKYNEHKSKGKKQLTINN